MARTPLPTEFATQKEAILGGAFFVLPCEVVSLMQKVKLLAERQSVLGKLLGEAMTESSETFHDNAPAEAIRDESGLVLSQFNVINKVLRNAGKIEYPTESSCLAISNTVSVTFNGSPIVANFFVTGYTRQVVTNNLIGLSQDTEIISAGTPLGLCLLEKKVGDEVKLELPSRRPQDLTIVGIGAVTLNELV